MKVSYTWLKKFFDAPLPSVEEVAETLTFHSSEIEEIAGDLLDVNVLPDRACYLLSHRGIAYEISAALNIPLAHDPLGAPLPTHPSTDEVRVTVCDTELVPRFSAALVRGVTVGPSPDWLREALASVGQRSINNVVDAANYVMLNIGQPVHAFDAGKLTHKDGAYALNVRKAYEGEQIVTLMGEEYTLPEGALLVVDAHTDAPVGIAGIKGGKTAEVTETTTDLVIEVANFDATQVRRTAQALKLFTDASTRFQNRPSPSLVGYGMRDVLALVTEIAGGKVVGVVDTSGTPEEPVTVTVTREAINGLLGTDYSVGQIGEALNRLMLPHEEKDGTFAVTMPFVRRDLLIPEDIAEEVGRTLGYEEVPSTELPPLSDTPDQRRYRGVERLKDVLLERGYVEIQTPSFAETGEVELANPLQTERPYLRANLAGNMDAALVRAKREAPRVLGPEPWLKLFEVGTVFTNAGEHTSLVLGYEPLEGKSMLDEDIAALIDALPGLSVPAHDGRVAELSLGNVDLEAVGEGYEPKRIKLGPFQPFSSYPFALRDIAVWVPEGTEETEVSLLVQKEAGELLARMDRFDRFEKDGRISYAFRLVFEAKDRTLSDADLDPLMERITSALNAREGWQVR